MKEWTKRGKQQIEYILHFLRSAEKLCPVCALAKRKKVHCDDGKDCPMKKHCDEYRKIVEDFKKKLLEHSKKLTEEDDF